MSPRDAVRVLLAVALYGCAQSAPPAGAPRSLEAERAGARQTARREVAERARRLELLLGQKPETSRANETGKPLRIVGMDDGLVPEFELETPGGVHYSSKTLVGQQPFVTV